VAEEIDSRREYPCPCGAGTYTVEIFANDWRATRDSWQMNCPACLTTHRLETFSYRESGRLAEGKRWATVAEWEAEQRRRDTEATASRAERKRIEAVIQSAADDGLTGAAAHRLAAASGYTQSLSTFYRGDWRRAQLKVFCPPT
jgi:hypothetical protein